MQARQRCGEYFWVCSCGKRGRSQAPPLRWNYEITLKFISALSRFMVGVGLCSTRGTLAVPQGLSGRAMLAPTMKLRKSDIIIMKILPFACRGLHCRSAPLYRDLKWRCFFAQARPFANLRQEKIILHKCSLVLCTKMGYNKIKLLP